VTDVSHKRVVMSLTRRRVHNAAADMTELFNPRPVHDGQGSGSSNEGQCRPSSRAAQISKTTWRGRRVSPPPPPASVTKKAPRLEGPGWGRRDRRPKLGSSLRGCSSREPLQERP